MAPNHKVNDSGNTTKPKRSREVLPLCDKITIIDLVMKEKKSYAEVGRMFNKNESSIREIVKKEKQIRASIMCAPKTAKVTSVVRDKCLVKTEKALNLWVEGMNRMNVPVNSNIMRQRALRLYKDFSKGSIEKNNNKPFTASNGWLHRFRNRYELKYIKITGEANKDAGEVKNIFQAASELRGNEFVDMIDEDIKHIEDHKEFLIDEELNEFVNSSANEEEEEEPAMWTLHKFHEVFQIAQNLKDKIMEYDPWMERSIKVTHMITEGLSPLQVYFDELKRKRKQLPNTTQEKDKEKTLSIENNEVNYKDKKIAETGFKYALEVKNEPVETSPDSVALMNTRIKEESTVDEAQIKLESIIDEAQIKEESIMDEAWTKQFLHYNSLMKEEQVCVNDGITYD